jgi:Glycosyltransferase family 87
MLARRIARLAVVGGLGGFVLLACYWIYAAALILPHSGDFSDFRVYYSAAWVGTHYGWSHIYDARLGSLAPVPGLYPFANPPLVAWLAAPLTALPYAQGQLIWTILLGLVTVAAAWTVSQGGAKSRLLGAGLVLATLPAVVTIAFGQSIAICFAAVAAGQLLEKRSHQVAAGVVLSLAFLKPQDVVLVPLQLLLARRFRTVVALAATGAVLLSLSFATLGPTGLWQWLGQIQAAGQFSGMRQWNLESFLPPALAWAVRVSAVGLAAAVAHFTKRTDQSLAAGVIGSLLISPYGSPADLVLVVYFVAQMLVGPDSIVPRSAPFMVIGGAAWLVISTMTTTRGLVPAVEFVLLLALFVACTRRATPAYADAQLQPAPGPIP